MKTPLELVLPGFVRGQVGVLVGPHRVSGSQMAIDAAIDVAAAGGRVLCITQTAPDVPPGLNGILFVDVCKEIQTHAYALQRYINCKIAELALNDLALIVIDQTPRAPDVISGLKIIAERYNAAVAYLPPPRQISPQQLLNSLARITDDAERLQRLEAARFEIRFRRARSEFAHWSKTEADEVLQQLDRTVMLAPFKGLSDLDKGGMS